MSGFEPDSPLLTTKLAWQSFLPWHVLQYLAQNPAAPVGQAQRFEAVALFADISGFTAMSEALAASGRAGAEELTKILNSYFLPMIDLVHAYGGTIGKFGGDAMTVLFPTLPPPQPSPIENPPIGEGTLPPPSDGWGRAGEGVARRALQCALEMQARMPHYAAIHTSAGTFSLAMKAGLAVGPVLATLAGDPAIRLEYVIAGEVLDLCADAEHHAAPGLVIAHRDLLALAGEELTSKDEFLPIERLRPRPHPQALPLPGNLSLVSGEIGWAFIHPSIAERLRRSQESLINEHRRVTVLFMGFSGFDYDHDAQASQSLQNYLDQVFRCVARYGGYVNKVDMGDKGSKIVILFGAPIAQEDDTPAALRCALELARLPGAEAYIGINTGFVFCGQVGSPARREYTVMGDAVNLAARLMQKASGVAGQILVGETTQQAAGERFEWGEAAATPIKGKQEPVQVFPLWGECLSETMRLQEPRYNLPMVGRLAELEQARSLLGRAVTGRGQILGLTAEAGMGKSRLAAEVIRLAGTMSLTVYGGECLSHAAQSSYLVWKPILRSVFGLDTSQSTEAQITQLRAALAAMNPALLPRLPLLGQPLDLPIPDNDTTRSMEIQLRKTAFEDLVSAFLCHVSRRQPLLIVLEDCHWIDPLSADLLETVGRDIVTEKIMLLAVYRPPDEQRAPLAITRQAHFSETCLREFSLAETELLIGYKLAQFGFDSAHIPPNLVTRINERAQGNPFFVDEMVNWLHDRGIAPDDTAALETLALPDSLYSLIISRIDQLEDSARTTLKVASVLGRSFRANWLWGIFPEVGAPERVRSQLTQLADLEFTPLDRPDPELEYLFKHIVTREVAYESLAVATRQMLHEQAGQFIEAKYPHDLERYVDLLAYHYGQSSNTIKQIEYFEKAAQAAQKAYANTVAVAYYQRLLPLIHGPREVEVLLHLGKLQLITGEWDQVEAGAQRALSLTQYPDQQAAASYLLGALQRSRGNYPQALKWLRKALRGFNALGIADHQFETLREMGIVFWSQGEYSRALRYFQRCLSLGRAAQDQAEIILALTNISAVYNNQEDYHRALRYAKRGLDMAETHGNRMSMSKLTGNIGTIYQALGDYSQAMDCFTRYLALSQELGFRLGVSIAVGNMGMIYLDCGYPDQALPCFTLNEQMASSLGDQLGVAFALWSLALARQALGELAEAADLIEKAIIIGESLELAYELSDFLASQVTLLAEMGRWSEAQTANQRALAAARKAERQPLIFQAQHLSPWLALKTGAMDRPQVIAALMALQTALDPADESQLAAWHYMLWQVTGSSEHSQKSAKSYAALYAHTPNVLYRQRYSQLTGIELPRPPALPPLPEIVG